MSITPAEKALERARNRAEWNRLPLIRIQVPKVDFEGHYDLPALFYDQHVARGYQPAGEATQRTRGIVTVHLTEEARLVLLRSAQAAQRAPEADEATKAAAAQTVRIITNPDNRHEANQ